MPCSGTQDYALPSAILGRQEQRVSYMKSGVREPGGARSATEILSAVTAAVSPGLCLMGRDEAMCRVTFMGRYNERASPGLRRATASSISMDGGKMNIYTCTIDGSGHYAAHFGRRGTTNIPTWSPDGMLIAFSSDRSGSHQIYICGAMAECHPRITNGGDNTAPTWSWYTVMNQPTKQEGQR